MTVENKNKKLILDKIQGHVNATLLHFLNEDAYSSYFPILSKDTIDEDNQFFKINNISVAGGLTSDEYKTASYLAMFYKFKANYNIDNINRYLKFIGYTLNGRAVELLALDKLQPYNSDNANYITLSEYFSLSPQVASVLTHDILSTFINTNLAKSSVASVFEQNAYIDGFDYGFDYISMR